MIILLLITDPVGAICVIPETARNVSVIHLAETKFYYFPSLVIMLKIYF